MLNRIDSKINDLCDFKRIAKIHVVFSLIYPFLSLMGIFVHVYGMIVDTLLTTLHILIIFLFYKTLKKLGIDAGAQKQKKIFILELLLVFIYFNMTGSTSFMKCVICLIYAYKYYLDYKVWSIMYHEAYWVQLYGTDIDFSLDPTEWKNTWRGVNIFLAVVVFFVTILKNTSIVVLVFISLIMRFLTQFTTIDDCNILFKKLESLDGILDSEEKASGNATWMIAKAKNLSKLRIVRNIVLILFLLAFLCLRYCYYENDFPVYMSDTPKNIEQYYKRNLMGIDNSFEYCKFGLRDTSTGFDTGAIYDEELHFDSTGIAWDYSGHFIDAHGKIVVNVPVFLCDRRSHRQSCIYNIFAELSGNHAEWFSTGADPYRTYTDEGRFYLIDGVFKFDTELFGKAIISDKGEIKELFLRIFDD